MIAMDSIPAAYIVVPEWFWFWFGLFVLINIVIEIALIIIAVATRYLLVLVISSGYYIWGLNRDSAQQTRSWLQDK